MRDYHTNPPSYGPMFISTKVVADALNATLLARWYAQIKMSLDLGQYPLLNPAVQLYESSNNTVEVFWKKYRFSHPGETAYLLRVQSIGFNFAYCDIPSVQNEKFWNISILINAFDAYIWMAMILSMVIISAIIHFLNDNTFPQAQRIFSFLAILFSVLSALISVGPSFVSVWFIKKSGLFVLWMLICIVVVNYYSGSITSLLISPPTEDAMTKISDTIDRNYSLIFGDPVHLSIVNATVRNYLEGDNGLDRQGTMKSVKHLLDRMGKHSVIQNQTKYKKTITYTPKTLILYLWTFVLSTINDANDLIAKEQPIASKRRHCYVGKHLIPSADTYVGVTPPESERLRNVFQTMLDSGLFSYWFTEFLKLGYAKRVQDRSKVVSPTQIHYDFASVVSPLQMEGKILTVFFLWIVCIGSCGISFAIEVMHSRRNRVKTLQ
ncbi:unnamed protein product [Orchesella dallaii]|uniref:Ionotropic glutamate receptor C-terminal domain-containing protein n=1 Tax=Orchesella dallaii TaxID=48710 RepID=A0ABP1RED5_9HEXA